MDVHVSTSGTWRGGRHTWKGYDLEASSYGHGGVTLWWKRTEPARQSGIPYLSLSLSRRDAAVLHEALSKVLIWGHWERESLGVRTVSGRRPTLRMEINKDGTAKARGRVVGKG